MVEWVGGYGKAWKSKKIAKEVYAYSVRDSMRQRWAWA